MAFEIGIILALSYATTYLIVELIDVIKEDIQESKNYWRLGR
jgi:hypothetical protein